MDSKHKSDTLLLAVLLSLSGGFQDAYTYVLRGNVFANAQTGNVVFMSQHVMTGDFRGALRCSTWGRFLLNRNRPQVEQ